MTKAYIVKLSNGGEVQIDGDELSTIIGGIKGGSIIRVKQGLINPSFIVSVTQDKARIREFMEDTKYQDENSQQRRAKGLLPLRDLFDGILPPPQELKKLS